MNKKQELPLRIGVGIVLLNNQNNILKSLRNASHSRRMKHTSVKRRDIRREKRHPSRDSNRNDQSRIADDMPNFDIELVCDLSLISYFRGAVINLRRNLQNTITIRAVHPSREAAVMRQQVKPVT